MLLAIDVGNSQITFGLFQSKQFIARWHIPSDVTRSATEYADALVAQKKTHPLESITGAILVSVVPALTQTIQAALQATLKIAPRVVTHRLQTGLTIRYADPTCLGADRIVNAAAAYHLYGGATVIVDFGTATTFCAVSEMGEYLGGAIAPGLSISAEALFSRAAQLPRVALIPPKQALCTNTVHSMQSGILFGHVGLVNEMVRRIWREMGREAPVTATGGFCELIAPECKTISRINPNLTLEGLQILYEMNPKGS